eukprot:TRINITY_DN266_c0_g2_i1.p1 TRINITY_DN266_c0_g2~~TRINITY_DN266_c0_g2_i1.p1  ORF type:complete len:805 (+),score=211.01 TRINITY_DN266_c0_g2_i1:55-2415(+)
MLLYLCTILLVPAAIEWKPVVTLGVRGQAHGFETMNHFDRIPMTMSKPRLMNMLRHTAGYYVDFVSTSDTLYLKGDYAEINVLGYYASPSVVMGWDLYRWDPVASRWRWASAAFQPEQVAFNYTLATGLGTSLAKYRMHFPMYMAVDAEKLFIGHEVGASIEGLAPAHPGGAIIWGGTSICHGTGAMTPGNAFTNQLRMLIGIEVHNMCFAGTGFYDPNTTQHFINIDPPPVLFVLDHLRNSHRLADVETIVRMIRKRHPRVPILLPDGPLDRRDWAKSRAYQGILRTREEILRTKLQLLRNEGVERLYHVGAARYYNLSFDPKGLLDYTVDRSHPSDIGNLACARYHASHIPSILAGKPSNVYPTENFEPVAYLPEKGDFQEPQAQAKPDLKAMAWQDVVPHMKGLPFGLQGENRSVLTRLPEDVNDLPPSVVRLGQYSTGMRIYFNTTSSAIGVNLQLEDIESWTRMPGTLVGSVDLYKWDADNNMYRGIMASVARTVSGGGPLLVEDNATPGSYLMYLPVFSNARAVEVGVDMRSEIHFEEARYLTDEVVVWYGGGMAMGTGVHRAGNAMLNILSRTMGVEVVNMGFHRAGLLETEVGKMVARAGGGRAALYVVDVIQDATVEVIIGRLAAFVDKIREGSDAPILFVACPRHGAEWYVGVDHEWAQRRRALQREVQQLRLMHGNLHLFLNEDEELYAGDDHGTYGNGVDPNDLGHLKAALFYAEYLKRFLPKLAPDQYAQYNSELSIGDNGVKFDTGRERLLDTKFLLVLLGVILTFVYKVKM